MKEKQVTKFFLACSTLVTCITLGINLTFRHAAHAVIAESGQVSPTATSDFIASIGETARQIGQDRNLYASVMIAQAVLESNSGQSALSQEPYYNFFGIKGAYNGNSVTMQTWEDDGSGNTYEVDQDFRSYNNLADSLNDYANLLSWSLYSDTWKSNTSSYQDATAALTGRYATDTSYADKLNALIEQYGLTTYDEPVVTDQTQASSEETQEEQTNQEAPQTTNPNHVWNKYRGSYTSSEVLAEDEAWIAFIH
ncbi:Flagellum-specific peptidoglycan hydrolase FlgJ [Streptococcus equinus]|uniref:Flagellum-specific peptidoglycan hydrolase FlgJ n=1 Tax=Streptococcus equinus TaxID=1335 RepID=A0A1H0JZV9_STREI|nr:glucosaminidase domain-containing protein [Streptococcus equinus]SDO49003.1 Flagellum-specific peptidoglycan hydrolase FlgJ [Streptococcus equinus]